MLPLVRSCVLLYSIMILKAKLSDANMTVLALIAYDWLLCLSQEITLVWRSKPNAASLVYASSRYSLLVQSILSIATEYPMSDLVSHPTTALSSRADSLFCV